MIMERKSNSTAASASPSSEGLALLHKILKDYGIATVITGVAVFMFYKFMVFKLEEMKMDLSHRYENKVYLVDGHLELDPDGGTYKIDFQVTEVNSADIVVRN